jgi:two-component system sensor histidine kinase KdpD
VLIDPVEIDQVVANLVENAAKYSPGGASVRIAADVVDGELRVAVEDHGPGVPSEVLTRLFDPFYRAPGTGNVRGSGLGLAVARGLVAAHGGRIWGENLPHGGARFAFTLPMSPIGAQAAE